MKTTNFFIYTTLLIVTFFASLSHAEDISVVDVRRNITLSDDELPYKDFYINAGDGSALRKNMVINVKRKINIRDSGTKSVGDFETIVGQLKVIHIGNKVSVAREFKLQSRDEDPMLEQIGIMTGDRIDLTDARIDNSRPIRKNKSSENETSKAEKEAIKTADATQAVETTQTPPHAAKPVAPPVESSERAPAQNESVPLNQALPIPQI